MAGHRTAAFCETSPKVLIPVPAWFRLTVPLAENTSSGWQSGSCILNRTWLYQDLFPFFFVLHVLLWRMRWREVFPQWQFKPGLFCDVIPQSLSLGPLLIQITSNSKGFAVLSPWIILSPLTSNFHRMETDSLQSPSVLLFGPLL